MTMIETNNIWLQPQATTNKFLKKHPHTWQLTKITVGNTNTVKNISKAASQKHIFSQKIFHSNNILTCKVTRKRQPNAASRIKACGRIMELDSIWSKRPNFSCRAWMDNTRFSPCEWENNFQVPYVHNAHGRYAHIDVCMTYFCTPPG